MRKFPVPGGAGDAGDAGVTLVELLVTVVIIGIAFVAIVGGMTTAIMGSDMHRKQATSETVLRSYAEAVKANDTPYNACATAAQYSPGAVGLAVPSGYAASATRVEYWQPDAADPNTGSFVASLSSCSGSPAVDNGIQGISLEVASSDDRATEKVQIVKRKP